MKYGAVNFFYYSLDWALGFIFNIYQDEQKTSMYNKKMGLSR